MRFVIENLLYHHRDKYLYAYCLCLSNIVIDIYCNIAQKIFGKWLIWLWNMLKSQSWVPPIRIVLVSDKKSTFSNNLIQAINACKSIYFPLITIISEFLINLNRLRCVIISKFAINRPFSIDKKL